MTGSDLEKLPRIYLFGDSLTEMGFEKEDRGWGWQVAVSLLRDTDLRVLLFG